MDATALFQEFIAETEEHLEEMEMNLLRLEVEPNNREILNEIFRSAHTIKGSAEYLGVEGIAELSHQLESLLDLLRRGKRHVEKEIVDILMAAKDRLSKLIKDVRETQTERTEIGDLMKELEQLTSKEGRPEATVISQEPSQIKMDESTPMTDPPSDLEKIVSEQVDKNHRKLVNTLTEMEKGDRSPEKREILSKGIDDFISILRYAGRDDLIAPLEKLKEKCKTISSPEEISTLLMELDSLKTILSLRQTPIVPSDTLPEPTLQDSLDSNPKGSPPAGQEETYEEEHDQELFDIFLQHLKEQLSFLRMEADGLSKTENGAESLGRCLECIKALKSSANYMDYKKLNDLYEGWIGEIESAKDKLGRGKEVSFQFMHAYLDQITGLFPKYIGGIPSSSPPGAPEVKKEVVIDSLELVADEAQPEEPLFTELERILTPVGPRESPGPQSVPRKEDEQRGAGKGAEALASPLPETQGLTGSQSAKTEPSGFDKEEGPASPPGPKDQSFDDSAEKIVKHNLRVDAKKIDSLMNQVGEMVVNRALFSQLSFEMKDLQRQLQLSRKLDPREGKTLKRISFRINEATLALGRLVNELQEGVMKVRMLPIAQLFNRYPRLVRQLLQDTHKQVRLEIVGEETELDKMVIEEVSDPLIHIIRNAVDHGIETVEERLRLKKPEEGKLQLSAYHESNHVVIEVADDGRGIDPKLLRETALQKGISTESELDRMTQRELLSLIMKPGFSTATEVTKTSGRGVGMDVVKKNVEKLNGLIEIDSTLGQGTRIRIKIPLTLAIIQALLVRVATEVFTIPLSSVVETLRFFRGDVLTIEGVEVIHLRESTIPLLRLSKLFNLPVAAENSDKAFVVIISTGMKQVGLVVDDLMGEQEVVIKPLVDYLQENSGFSGATILGDGHISLILDVYQLVNLAAAKHARQRTPSVSLTQEAHSAIGKEPPRIMG